VVDTHAYASNTEAACSRFWLAGVVAREGYQVKGAKGPLGWVPGPGLTGFPQLSPAIPAVRDGMHQLKARPA
jgi:hypothetical protein